MERLSPIWRALRYPIRSHPKRFWGLTLSLATVTALVITTMVSDANRVSSELGTRVGVVVARHPLEAGHVVLGDDVFRREQSVGWLPDNSVQVVHAVIGSTVLANIAANEPVVSSRIGSATDNLDSQLRVGERGVAVTVPAGFKLAAGTPVELIVSDPRLNLDSSSAGVDSPAIAGRVIAIADEATLNSANRWATVAVAAASAPAAAQAGRANQLTLVLAPSPSAD